MSPELRISVIIPAYNVAEWLPRCIESVINQTYKNLEILIIDDGSTDETGIVADAYAEKDTRITAIHQENHGVSHARNQGLEMVTGDAVSFIDSDDSLELYMYEILVKYMDLYDAEIAHCGYKHIVGDEVRLVHDTKRIILQNAHEALDCFVSGRLFGGGLWSKLFRTELIRELKFREDLKINEDILFNFQAFCKAEKTVFVDYAMYNYIARLGSSAVFRTPDEKKIIDSCVVSGYIYEQMAGTELNDVAAERYIRSLCGHYEYCAENKPTVCRQISESIRMVAAKASHLSRNMTISVLLIRFCPWLYRLVRKAYARIRKPQWEARKD